jgi:hypothetical protein
MRRVMRVRFFAARRADSRDNGARHDTSAWQGTGVAGRRKCRYAESVPPSAYGNCTRCTTTRYAPATRPQNVSAA